MPAFTSCTLHTTLYFVHCTLHFAHFTLYTPNFKLYAPHCKPLTLHSALSASHFPPDILTLDSGLLNPHFTHTTFTSQHSFSTHSTAQFEFQPFPHCSVQCTGTVTGGIYKNAEDCSYCSNTCFTGLLYVTAFGCVCFLCFSFVSC